MLPQPTSNWDVQIRWLRSQNGDSTAVPAFGLVRVTAVDAEGLLTLARPNADGQDCLVNGPVPMAGSDYGSVSRDSPLLVAYDTGDGTPALGEAWGAGSGSYLLRKGNAGFVIDGVPVTGVALVHRQDVSSYTDEQAQDAVGAILTDTATIDLTYDDTTPAITADVKNTSITAAKLESATNGQLFIGNGSGFTKASLTAGANVTITPGSGSITIAASTGSVSGLVPAEVVYGSATGTIHQDAGFQFDETAQTVIVGGGSGFAGPGGETAIVDVAGPIFTFGYSVIVDDIDVQPKLILSAATGDDLAVIQADRDLPDAALHLQVFDAGAAVQDVRIDSSGLTLRSGTIFSVNTATGKSGTDPVGNVFTGGIVTTIGSGSGYTDEMAQDAIGGILTDTATIDFTYDDATPAITADVKNTSITAAKLESATNGQLFIGNGTGFTKASLTAGSNVTITPGASSITIAASGGSGTVTSVDVSLPNASSGGAVTGSGTVALTWNSQSPHQFFASPTGSSGAPTFRDLDAADVVSGTLPKERGGTGQSSYTNGDILYFNGDPGLDKLGANTSTTRKFLNQVGDGSGFLSMTWDTIAASDITTGQLAAARGGTGVDGSAAANGKLLIGNGSGYTLATLTAGTGITITNGAGSITIDSSSGYTDEQAQDAVGTILVDSSSIDFTYNDATPSITADIKTAGVTSAMLRDSAALSVLGRSAATSGVPGDIAASANGQFLQRTANVISFAAIAAGDLPNHSAALITSGTLAVARGGTGADMSAAGAGFVKQATSGANFTVATIAAGDLPNHSAALLTSGTLALARGGTGADLSATGAGFLKQATSGATVTVAALAAGDIPSLDAAKITTGTFAEARGGTNQSTYTMGDLLYSSAANTLAKLAGNTTTTHKFLAQTGTGTISAAPLWDTLVAGDIPSLAASKITTGQLALARGGTGADLSATGSGVLVQDTTGATVTVQNPLPIKFVPDLNGFTDTDVAADDAIPLYDTSAAGNRDIAVNRLLGFGLNSLCQGRLTLATGVDVTIADQTAKTSVFFTPSGGNRVSLYDGTRWLLYTFSELTLALGTVTTLRPYDVFLADVSGTLTLEKVAWTSDTVRATNLVLQDGVLVKSGATTRRYLGTFRTTSTTTTEDSLAKRFVWNYYNRRARGFFVTSSTSHAYTAVNTWRQWNAAAANKFEFIAGIAEDSIAVTIGGSVVPTGGLGYLGMRINATNSADLYESISISADVIASYIYTSPITGYNFVAAVEQQNGTTTTFGNFTLVGMING